jgi:predicted transcriptional regulator
VSAFSSWSGWLNTLSWTLEQCPTLLGLPDTDLEVHEAILAVERECGLHPPDARDLSVELDKARASVNRMAVDRAVEAERLSRQVVQVASVLVDFSLLPVEDIP